MSMMQMKGQSVKNPKRLKNKLDKEMESQASELKK